MSIHGDRANPYTLWLAAYDLLGEKPAQRLGSATPSGKRWSRAKPITEPSPQGRSNSPYVAGDAPGSSTTSPRPTSSTWSPAPSSATGPSGSTTAGPAQTGCCAVQQPRRMTRRARFAMSTPWREGRATGSSSSPDDRHPRGLGQLERAARQALHNQDVRPRQWSVPGRQLQSPHRASGIRCHR
jgi:hypothetical protein